MVSGGIFTVFCIGVAFFVALAVKSSSHDIFSKKDGIGIIDGLLEFYTKAPVPVLGLGIEVKVRDGSSRNETAGGPQLIRYLRVYIL